MGTPQQDYEKDLSTLRKHLLGAEYRHAVKALEYAPQYHTGFRKDGVTPSFHHQIKIAFSAYDDRAIIKQAGLKVDDVIAAAILHDTYEDNQPTLRVDDLASRFGPKIARLVLQLSKVRNGITIPTDQYYQELLDYPEALIVKLYDRRNNVEGMLALSPKKLADYILETRHLIEVSKLAIVRYPELEGLIQHSRSQLKQYLHIYEATFQLSAEGKAGTYVEALQEAGILWSPDRPSARNGGIPAEIPAIA